MTPSILSGISEAVWTKNVLDFATHYGWTSLHIRPARSKRGWLTPVAGDGVGWPDIFLIRPPRIVVAELKRVGGRLTPSQKMWLALFRQVPGIEVFVWYPTDREEVLRILA